jgi:hypothetical protein
VSTKFIILDNFVSVFPHDSSAVDAGHFFVYRSLALFDLGVKSVSHAAVPVELLSSVVSS